MARFAVGGIFRWKEISGMNCLSGPAFQDFLVAQDMERCCRAYQSLHERARAAFRQKGRQGCRKGPIRPHSGRPGLLSFASVQ